MSVWNIGFTGTQNGMTIEQMDRLDLLLKQRQGTTFHHGDCVGADAQAHNIAESLGYQTIAHPPDKSHKRAFCNADRVRDQKPYLERNVDIVRESDEMIACPGGKQELRRSGTWATVRTARRLGRPLTIIYPDGSMVFEPGEV